MQKKTAVVLQRTNTKTTIKVLGLAKYLMSKTSSGNFRKMAEYNPTMTVHLEKVKNFTVTNSRGLGQSLEIMCASDMKKIRPAVINQRIQNGKKRRSFTGSERRRLAARRTYWMTRNEHHNGNRTKSFMDIESQRLGTNLRARKMRRPAVIQRRQELSRKVRNFMDSGVLVPLRMFQKEGAMVKFGREAKNFLAFEGNKSSMVRLI